jgi:NAD(P)-dependent dehydrogenase (short-subunit alcohol dehydrogenase family)
MKRQSLQNKVCVVTGGAQGLGWAIAKALAKRGAIVSVCDISQEYIENARRELKVSPYSKNIEFARCDVTVQQDVVKWVNDVYSQNGSIDLLVNNAAFVKWQDVMEMSVEDDLKSMQVGYDGMVFTTKAILPLMKKAGQGHIVNISSIMGHIFVGSASAAYCAVKAAINAYSQILQIELRKSPIHLTLVRPSTISGTAFFGKYVSYKRMPKIADYFQLLTPEGVAEKIVIAVEKNKKIIDLPFYMKTFYHVFALFPGFMRWLGVIGNGGTKDYGKMGCDVKKEVQYGYGK